MELPPAGRGASWRVVLQLLVLFDVGPFLLDVCPFLLVFFVVLLDKVLVVLQHLDSLPGSLLGWKPFPLGQVQHLPTVNLTIQ